MKLSADQQQSLVTLLARFCDEIIAIESEYHLMLSQADLRPRIDYFHDAIRAFTAARSTPADEERLGVQRLAYDVRALRFLAEKPLSPLSPDQPMSPTTALVTKTQPLVATAKKPDRNVKEQLSELYKQYGLLFSALLKPAADLDYHERTDAMNEEVTHIKEIEALLKNNNAQALSNAAAHLDNQALQAVILQYLKQSTGKQKASLPTLLANLKLTVQKLDKAILAVDNAHHAYATTQLAIYENGKDTLKKMMSHGINIVGAFVEASVRNNKQGKGR